MNWSCVIIGIQNEPKIKRILMFALVFSEASQLI